MEKDELGGNSRYDLFCFFTLVLHAIDNGPQGNSMLSDTEVDRVCDSLADVPTLNAVNLEISGRNFSYIGKLDSYLPRQLLALDKSRNGENQKCEHRK